MAGRKGRSGRKRVPAALKKQRGTRVRKARARAEAEISFPVTAVSAENPPVWLDDEGKMEWRRVVSMLQPLGLLTDADLPALAHLCAADSKAKGAEKILAKDGLMKGKRAHPMIAVAKQARDQYRALAVEFGFTPASRTRISRADPPPPRAPLPAPAPAQPQTEGAAAEPVKETANAEKFLFGGLTLVKP